MDKALTVLSNFKLSSGCELEVGSVARYAVVERRSFAAHGSYNGY